MEPLSPTGISAAMRIKNGVTSLAFKRIHDTTAGLPEPVKCWQQTGINLITRQLNFLKLAR